MRTLNKHIKASTAANRNWKAELPVFLRQYRGTPHSSSGVSPFEALTNRKMNIGLPSPPHDVEHFPVPVSVKVSRNHMSTRQRMSSYANQKRHTKPSDLQPGDHVLVKQKRENKLTPPFSPKPFIVTTKHGSMITAHRKNGTSIVRNSSHFRKLSGIPPRTMEDTDEDEPSDSDSKFPFVHVPPVRTPHKTLDNTSSPTTPLRTPSEPPPPTSSTNTPRKVISAPQMPSPTFDPVPSPSPLQRPTRQRRPPTYLKDYDLG